MRRRLFGKLAEKVTLSYGKPVITYLAYGVVPVGGVEAGTPFLPSYRYYVPVTETVTRGTSTTSTTTDVEVTNSTDLSTLPFVPSLSFRIVPDGRTDVDIVEDTGSLIVGNAYEVYGEDYYGVGTVYMKVTVDGKESAELSCDVSQAENTWQITTAFTIDITRFDYDAAAAEGADNVFPNLDFTVTETKEYSDGSPSETIVDNVSYRNGARVSGGEWSPRFTRVSGDFSVNSSTGLVYNIEDTTATGDENIEIGEVRVDIDIASYTSAYATTKVYQKTNEAPKEDTSFPMDILMLNNETHKQEIMGRDEHTTKDFPKEKYTPIGIILTPIADDTGFSAGKQYSGYGNDIGVMGVIALTDASLSNSEVGTTNPSEIMCGNEWSYDDSTGLWCIPSVYTILPYIDTNGTPTNDIQGDANLNWSIPDYNNNQISVATDKSDTKASPVDAWSGYANANGYKAASPYYVTEEYKDEVYNGESDWDFEGYNEIAYDKYDTFNPNTDDISAFADYNGELNSLAILIRKSWTRGREWIENTTVNSNSNMTDCPAVEACWKYAPEGTAQGGWYLPAIGELLLMAARFNKINNTLTLLNQYYGVSVSLLKDTNVPYLSSTSFHSSDVYDSSIDAYVSSRLVFALFPNVNGDAGVNNICTTSITGATRYGGYVRPFKKIKNEIPSNASVNAYNFTPHYELMPAHYTDTLCNGDSEREWFGQKFIVSFRRACMGQLANTTLFSSVDGSCLRIYGYKVRGENDTTKVDDVPRLLAETYVNGAVSQSLMQSTCDHWPQVTDGQGGYKYEGDEKGLNIVGRFTTGYQFDKDGAFDEEKGDYVDMDTDEFDRDGTVEPGWYVLAGVGVTTTPSGSGVTQETIISTPFYQTITKKEIDIIDEVESKEAFFDEIRNSTLSSLTEKTDAPFYVGQLDRPVAILLGSETINESD